MLSLVLKTWTPAFQPPNLQALSLEMAAQIQELSLYIKNCAKCIAYIISPFLAIWKIDIISLVYMREMMLAELELEFKPKSC